MTHTSSRCFSQDTDKVNLKVTKLKDQNVLSQSILEIPHKFNFDLKTEEFTPVVNPSVKIMTK